MGPFELTANLPMALNSDIRSTNSDSSLMNIRAHGIMQNSIYSNPGSRTHAIEQFSANVIDVSTRQRALCYGNGDVSKIPNVDDQMPENNRGMSDILHFRKEISEPDKVIDDVEMKKGCIQIVQNFYDEGFDMKYGESGIQGRCEIATAFYSRVKEQMGIDSEFQFSPMAPKQLGGFNPQTNSIDLNAKYLENDNCEDLLNTILHEARHGFQAKCIESPDSVTVKDNIIEVWKDNIAHYVRPEDDFVAYENQEIEKDSNYFADSVMRDGINTYYA